ncbi:MAG: metal-dependent transcriptional regulator [Caldisericia bacterium]|nr:metal-dependent transcriptional regulator [Caldisericia bacterium]
MQKKNITMSQEDYLEAILRIFNEKKGVRTKDIANKLDVKNSSVTSALKHLSVEGYINYEPYGIISLTEKGETIANTIWLRHQIMYFFFHDILLLSDIESKNIACSFEHSFTDNAFEKMLNYLHENHTNELEAYLKNSDIDKKYFYLYCKNCRELDA